MIVHIYYLVSTRDINDIRYIGKTIKRIERRLQAHLTDARRSISNAHKWKWNHNWNWISHEISEGYEIKIFELDSIESDGKNWEWLEQYWISQMKAWGFNLNNLTKGGDGNKNQRFSKEAIEKRRAKMIGRHIPDYVRAKISKSNSKPLSPEHRRIVTEKNREMRNKPILQYSLDGKFIKEWECMNDAAKFYNVTCSHIASYMKTRDKRRSAIGFQWKFKNETHEIKPVGHCQSKWTEIYDKDTRRLIKRFRTLNDASKMVGAHVGTVSIHAKNGKPINGYIIKTVSEK